MSVNRDFRPRKGNSKKKSGRRKGLAIFTLVLIVALVSALGYLSGFNKEDDGPNSLTKSKSPPVQDARAVRKQVPKNIPPPPKAKYDFYKVLPERELEIRSDELREQSTSLKTSEPMKAPSAAKKSPSPATQQTTSTSSVYLIQAGSFRNAADAERVKAQLALSGITSRVEAAKSADGTVWNRVRIGPVKGAEAAQAMRERLSAKRIESLAIKVK